LRTEVPEGFRNAILDGIEEGEKRVKLRNKIKTACAAAALVCLIAGLAALGLEPRQDETVPSQGIVTSQPQEEVYISAHGVYYHTVSDCSGMENAQVTSIDSAEEMGKKACPVCAAGEEPAQDADSGDNVTAETAAVLVYATQYGTYYHAISDCSGMKNAEQMTLPRAVSMGKSACPDCIPAEQRIIYSDAVYARLEAYAPGALGCISGTFGLSSLCTRCISADGTYGYIDTRDLFDTVATLHWTDDTIEMSFHTDTAKDYGQNLLATLNDSRVMIWYKNALDAINRYFGYDVKDSLFLFDVFMAFTTDGEMTDLHFLWEGMSKLILIQTNTATGEIYVFSVSSPG